MLVEASQINHVPIMVVPNAPKEWSRVFGGSISLVPGSVAIPAYYPLGLRSFSELNSISRGNLELSPSALECLRDLKSSHESHLIAEKHRKGGHGIDLDLPPGWKWIKNEPYQHQRLGIHIGLNWWRHWYLWEMGTGKTKVAVETWRLRKARGDFRKALVLCPRVVVPTWLREIREHSDDELSSWEWDNQDPDRAIKAAAADVVVVTYTMARMEATAALRARTADTKGLSGTEKERLQQASKDPLAALVRGEIWADESHCMGSWKSQQTRAACILSNGKARRFCLSGTAADTPYKLYGQLLFLAPALMPKTYDKFVRDHVISSKENRAITVGFKGIQWLNEQVNLVASRMNKSDCLDLPERTVIDLPFTLNPAQASRYNELADEWLVSAVPGIAVDTKGAAGSSDAAVEVLMEMPHAAARLAKVMQVTSGFIMVSEPSVDLKPKKWLLRDFGNPKLETFEELLETILEDDEAKVLCWANLIPELDDMEETCKKRGWGYVRLDGRSTGKSGEIEQQFQTDPRCKVMIGVSSVGVGITLTAANFTVYYSPPFNRVHYRQSLDRNHRPGQNRKITVYRLIGKDTVESAVLRVLERKEDFARMLTAKVDCSCCVEAVRCKEGNIQPFKPGCIFEPEFIKSFVKVEAVYGHRS